MKASRLDCTGNAVQTGHWQIFVICTHNTIQAILACSTKIMTAVVSACGTTGSNRFWITRRLTIPLQKESLMLIGVHEDKPLSY